MNIGHHILELRKQKNVTQEEIAAELGVTATAVSKWENNYTLPDIMMLCALADYFQVTTDELLGRNISQSNAIIISKTKELGKSIAKLTEKYNIQSYAILTDYADVFSLLENETMEKIKYIFTALDEPPEEHEMDNTQDITHVNVHVTGGTDEDILNGIELYLKNEDAFKNFRDITATGKR